MDRERSSGLRLQIHALHRSSGELRSPSTDTSSPLRSAAASLSPSPSPAWSFFFIAVQVFDRLLLFKVIRDEPGLYPSMTENPALRWAFIRKGYTILTVQLLLTAATVVLVRPVTLFFVDTYAGLGLLIADFVLALAVVVALRFCGKKYPVNFILMGLFTVLIGVIVGMHCVFTQEKVLLEAFGITLVIFISLTLYTFWAASRGYDFRFLGPFLFAALTVLLGFSLIQIFHPLENTSHMIITLVGCIIFCGYIAYDADKLIKRHEYDEYMLAAVQLY